MRKARQSERMVKPRILLVINSEIGTGLQPRDEYEAIQQVLDADVLYPHDAQRTIIRRFITRLLGARIALIWTAFWQRDKYDVIYTDTELVGLPLAMLLKLKGTQGRQFRYVTLSHYLSPFKKKIFFHLGVGSRIDTLIVYSAAQQALATEVLRMPAERVVKLPFFVDKDFWRPVAIDRNATKNRPMIFVPGLECRDFATLIRAVADLDVEVRITATTAFGRGQFVAFSALPSNVSIGSCDFAEMRQLYTTAQFVVVP